MEINTFMDICMWNAKPVNFCAMGWSYFDDHSSVDECKVK